MDEGLVEEVLRLVLKVNNSRWSAWHFAGQLKAKIDSQNCDAFCAVDIKGTNVSIPVWVECNHPSQGEYRLAITGQQMEYNFDTKRKSDIWKRFNQDIVDLKFLLENRYTDDGYCLLILNDTKYE